jgi:hypothetical protein
MNFGDFFKLAIYITLGLFIQVGAYHDACAEQVDCRKAMQEWRELCENLDNALAEYKNIERTPVRNIIDGPVVDTGSSKTIAAQVSEALAVKENMLKDQRNLCRNIIRMEKELFEAVKSCSKRHFDKSEKREIRKLTRKRDRLIDKTRLRIAEVREVRGQEMDYSYAGYWNNQQQGRGRNPSGYWNHYQRMYQRWWGH